MTVGLLSFCPLHCPFSFLIRSFSVSDTSRRSPSLFGCLGEGNTPSIFFLVVSFLCLLQPRLGELRIPDSVKAPTRGSATQGLQ